MHTQSAFIKQYQILIHRSTNVNVSHPVDGNNYRPPELGRSLTRPLWRDEHRWPFQVNAQLFNSIKFVSPPEALPINSDPERESDQASKQRQINMA